MYENNYKAVYSMRRCALIDHPPPMTEKNCRKINLKFTDAASAVAMRSMDDAAEEVR